MGKKGKKGKKAPEVTPQEGLLAYQLVSYFNTTHLVIVLDCIKGRFC